MPGPAGSGNYESAVRVSYLSLVIIYKGNEIIVY